MGESESGGDYLEGEGAFWCDSNIRIGTWFFLGVTKKPGLINSVNKIRTIQNTSYCQLPRG